MSTLAVVEEVLREAISPLSVREIVELAGARLPSKSKTPDTVVARDLSVDIKKRGVGSRFVRTSPGRYALRAAAIQPAPVMTPEAPVVPQVVPMMRAGERAGTMPARTPILTVVRDAEPDAGVR